MAEASKVRLVRCPKCENLLPELPDFSIYKCGGCGTILKGTTPIACIRVCIYFGCFCEYIVLWRLYVLYTSLGFVVKLLVEFLAVNNIKVKMICGLPFFELNY